MKKESAEIAVIARTMLKTKPPTGDLPPGPSMAPDIVDGEEIQEIPLRCSDAETIETTPYGSRGSGDDYFRFQEGDGRKPVK